MNGVRYTPEQLAELLYAGTATRGDGSLVELRLCRHGCPDPLARPLGRAPWWRRLLAYFRIGGTP